MCQKLKPFLGEKIEKLYLKYRMSSDFKSKQHIEQTILMLYTKHFESLLSKKQINLVPPYPQQSYGKYQLGDVLYNGDRVGKFGLYDEEITRHIGIFGITGTGKSNTSFKIITELLNKGKRLLIFDWKKQYRDLLTLNPCPNLEIFGFGNPQIPSFTFNPLLPPKGVSTSQYIEHISEIIANSYFCGEGVISILRKTLKELFTKTKVPTFTDVLNELYTKKYTGRMKDWLASTIRSIEAICHGGLCEMVNVEAPVMDTRKLLQKNVVLELAELGQSQKMFIIQSLLLQIYYHKIGSRVSEKLKNVIVIEEAHHILLQKKYQDGQEPITDVLLKEIREFGVGLIIIDQNPSLMSVPALANNFTTIGMFTKHSNDIHALSRSMFLTPDQTNQLGRLKRGEAIVKLAGRIFYPFLVQFPKVPILKGKIRDSDVALHMLFQGYLMHQDKFPTISDKRTQNQTTSTHSNTIQLPTEKDEPLKGTFLSPDAKAFLMDIDSFPFDGVTIRQKRLGISARRGVKAVKELEEKGIMKKVEVKVGKTKVHLFEILNDGRVRCEEYGIKLTPVPKNHGGILHRYWVDRVRQKYERDGYKVIVEYPLENGGFVDVVAEKGNEKIAIEVETGKSDVKRNIEKCNNSSFSNVIQVRV